MSRHVIGDEREFRESSQTIIEVGGRSIGIFFKGGSWFALRNRCPHHGAELCRGLVSGTVALSSDDDLVYVMEDRVLRCPWHGFEFDLETGRALADPDRYRVRTYPITVENGKIVVEL